MARTFRRKETLTAMSEINVTPLIDLAFALLIIFMITTPLLEQAIPLNLPLENQKPQVVDEDLVFQVISIDRDGQLFWGKQAISLPALNQRLQDIASSAEPPVITIRADRAVPYQKVIDVIDLVKENKLSRIDLDTQVK